MPIVVACPNCPTKLSVPDSAAGKMARCPKCGAVALLVGVVAASVLAVRSGGSGGLGRTAAAPADPSKMTVENFRALRVGMTPAEADGVLGGGRPSSLDELTGALRRGGYAGAEVSRWLDSNRALRPTLTAWRRWEGKGFQVWVAFAGAAGGERAAFSASVAPSPHGIPNVHTGFSAGDAEVDGGGRAAGRRGRRPERPEVGPRPPRPASCWPASGATSAPTATCSDRAAR